MRPCAGCGKAGDSYTSTPKWCRRCWGEKVRHNKKAHAKRYHASARAYEKTPQRIEAREGRAKTERGRALQRERVRRYRSRHPEREAAHVAVSHALRKAQLRPQPCPCGQEKTQAHHNDYTQPLKVQWLCLNCHRSAHAEKS